MVFFYGSLIIKPNNTYKSTIKEEFRPKEKIQIIWTRADSSSLYPLTVSIDTNGIIKSESRLSDVLISGLTIWETN